MLSLPVRAGAACALIVVGAALGAIITGFSMRGGTAGAGHPHVSPPAVQAPGGPPQPPPSTFTPIPTGPPAVEVLQPQGDQDTIFLIHGVNWRPGTHLTIDLAGVGISAIRPLVDRIGTFNYAINQDQEFVRGPMPLGTFQIIVTGPAGQRATVQVQVTTGPPPGQAPPPQA